VLTLIVDVVKKFTPSNNDELVKSHHLPLLSFRA
jgi:hypothetical protein